MPRPDQLVRTALLLASVFICSHAHAELIDDLNSIRTRGCDGRAGATALRPDRALDAVAKEWSKGGRLQAALDRTSYRALSSASMRVAGSTQQALVIKTLRDNYCSTIVNGAFSVAGTYQHGKNSWIVVANPFVAPTVRDAEKLAAEILRRVNAARAESRRCGRETLAATTPLQASAILNLAALNHSQDMAKHDHFEHEGTDGSTPSQRVTRAGYKWRGVAENIAAGPTTAAEVVNGWLASPGHCANIMSPAYTEMGIGYAVNPKSRSGIYWSQVFAAPSRW